MAWWPEVLSTLLFICRAPNTISPQRTSKGLGAVRERQTRNETNWKVAERAEDEAQSGKIQKMKEAVGARFHSLAHALQKRSPPLRSRIAHCRRNLLLFHGRERFNQIMFVHFTPTTDGGENARGGEIEISKSTRRTSARIPSYTHFWWTPHTHILSLCLSCEGALSVRKQKPFSGYNCKLQNHCVTIWAVNFALPVCLIDHHERGIIKLSHMYALLEADWELDQRARRRSTKLRSKQRAV